MAQCAAALALAALVAFVGATRQRGVPQLVFESVGGANLEARLGAIDTTHLATIVRLVGLEDSGNPIKVLLAPEASAVARRTPAWIAGYANAPANTVVLFPSRALRYPHDSLEAVLHHEVAHVLIHRAARGQPVPRWFNEGLSTVAERTWTFEDRRQLAWALVAGPPGTMQSIDPDFAEGPPEATRAYAIASAFVREIIDNHGIDAPARILRSVGSGVSFQAAFERVTGLPLYAAERDFRAQLRSWERWVPLLTSPFVLWTATTVLALYAIVVARRRRAERRRKWDREEPDPDEVPPSTSE